MLRLITHGEQLVAGVQFRCVIWVVFVVYIPVFVISRVVILSFLLCFLAVSAVFALFPSTVFICPALTGFTWCFLTCASICMNMSMSVCLCFSLCCKCYSEYIRSCFQLFFVCLFVFCLPVLWKLYFKHWIISYFHVDLFSLMRFILWGWTFPALTSSIFVL